MNIHPTAIVSPGTELGAQTTVGPYTVIEPGVRIGENVCIGAHVTILPYTTIGSGCVIHSNAVLGDLPQDMAFENGESFVNIGAGTVIREGVTIHRGTKPGTATVTGKNCYLMANSHLAHNVRLGDKVIMANGALLGGYVEVGDRAFISGNALVHQFCRIGKLAMISGNCGISKDVPPFCMTRGLTLSTVSALNIVGLRRAGYGPEERAQIKQAFKLLYQSGLNVRQALLRIRSESPVSAVNEFCNFIEQSKRGICRFSASPDAGHEE